MMELAPQYIVALHRALLAALEVDYFPPGMSDVTAWQNFLFVMRPLRESAGGEFTAGDIVGAVRLMRAQNKAGGAKWSLRFGKIMNEPEAFRDLVLLARKAKRERAPIETTSRTDATGAVLQVERDPAAEAEAKHAGSEAAAQLRKFREGMKNGGQQS